MLDSRRQLQTGCLWSHLSWLMYSLYRGQANPTPLLACNYVVPVFVRWRFVLEWGCCSVWFGSGVCSTFITGILSDASSFINSTALRL